MQRGADAVDRGHRALHSAIRRSGITPCVCMHTAIALLLLLLQALIDRQSLDRQLYDRAQVSNTQRLAMALPPLLCARSMPMCE